MQTPQRAASVTFVSRWLKTRRAVSGERRFRQFGGNRRPMKVAGGLGCWDLQPPQREFGPDGDVCQHVGWGGSVPGRLKEKPAGADGRGTEQGGGAGEQCEYGLNGAAEISSSRNGEDFNRSIEPDVNTRGVRCPSGLH